MEWMLLILVCSLVQSVFPLPSPPDSSHVIEIPTDQDSLIWVVQLSDLHFSVFHPERARDFESLIGPFLALVNPSLVLITGDLTDGKSNDLLTMKQDEEEWIQYSKVMKDVIKRSGLSEESFYDLRGNHDSFGVPYVGSDIDFYQKYSINAGLGRAGHVQSVTLQANASKYLFVGFDSAMSPGIRGPTNFFGHPSDQLIDDLGAELSKWDYQDQPTVKIAFGHFPLSFSTSTSSGKNLKRTFFEHSLSVYLCGHLHTKFGKNLKRHHLFGHGSPEYFQLNIHNELMISKEHDNNYSCNISSISEFWEWEMGDWRKSRTVRILAIDAGQVSYVDLDFSSGSPGTIILPTFPVDSRFMQRHSLHHRYRCSKGSVQSYDRIRTLVFSDTAIVSVIVRIYDISSEKSQAVFESEMEQNDGNHGRRVLFTASWNWRAFGDSSAERFWMQIKVTDISGKSTLSQLMPFSVNGLTTKVKWQWAEFIVMGCHWSSLYGPLLCSVLLFLILFLMTPILLKIFPCKNFGFNRGLEKKRLCFYGIFWISDELFRIRSLWLSVLGYLSYLIFVPWFCGQVFTTHGNIGCMTHRGWWILNYAPMQAESRYIGYPDVMVIVLPHLVLVLLPTILIMSAMAADRMTYRVHYLSHFGKKNDDLSSCSDSRSKMMPRLNQGGYPSFNSSFCCSSRGRWTRKLILGVSVIVLWKHLMLCRLIMKAFEANPLIHSPVFCMAVPLLLAYSVYKTSGV